MKTELIAEIGQNHNGDMDLAARLIREASACGADAAKFQVFDARALFPPREVNAWYDYNLRCELTRDQVRELAARCAEAGIEFLASVFDVERLGWLEELGVRRYKLASRSIREAALIRALVATGKPLIVSLGQWRGDGFPEIAAAQRIDYLYCVSDYPARLEDLHLGVVDFARYAGFSDHSVGLTAAKIALSRGARIIEKHFTLDHGMHGPDHACSMVPAELGELHRFRTELEACL